MLRRVVTRTAAEDDPRLPSKILLSGRDSESNRKLRLTVGRNASCDVQLDFEDMPLLCSRCHAEVTVQEGVVSVYDENSLNGTFVNSVRMRERVELKDQDILTFGGPRLVKGKENPFIFKYHATPETPLDVKQEESKGENTNERKRKWNCSETCKTEMKQELECPICYNLMVCSHGLLCGHTFCGPCIFNWLRSSRKHTCPICREPVRGPPYPSIVLDKLVQHQAENDLHPAELEERAYKARRFELKQAQWDKKIKEFTTQQYGALRRIRDMLHSHMRNNASGLERGNRQQSDQNIEANSDANIEGNGNEVDVALPSSDQQEREPANVQESDGDLTTNGLPHQQQLVQLWREFERVRAADSGHSSEEAEATGLTNEQPIQHRPHREMSEQIANIAGTTTSSEHNNVGHGASVHDISRVASTTAVHTTGNGGFPQLYIPLRPLSQTDIA